MTRPIQVLIDYAALRHNYRQVKSCAPGRKAWAVIKANGYGHGQQRVAEALRDIADGFALIEIENAILLRELGINQPMLLLEGIFDLQELQLVRQHQLEMVVHCREQVEMLSGVADSVSALRLYIKLDTGMHRLGFDEADLPWLWSKLTEIKARQPLHLRLMTHFANADQIDGVDHQLERLQRMINGTNAAIWQAAGWQGGLSLSNSAALLLHSQRLNAFKEEWTRPGIALYGGNPCSENRLTDASLDLQPVMTLSSSILAVRQVAIGETVGYGSTFRAEVPTRVGIVACGYADGYPRHAGTGTPIVVGEQRTRTLGRVSMDMIACDITGMENAVVGTPVTLWGRLPGGGVLPADEIATSAETISYELFCNLSQRVLVRHWTSHDSAADSAHGA